MNDVVTKIALNYSEALYSMCPSIDNVNEALDLLKITELKSALSNPSVSLDEKYSVIDKLFDSRISGTIKVICKNGDYQVLDMLKAGYKIVWNYHNFVLEGTLEYADPLNQAEIEDLKTMLVKKYDVKSVELNLRQNRKLIKGYRMHINDRVYDNSAQSVLNRMYSALVRR